LRRIWKLLIGMSHGVTECVLKMRFSVTSPLEPTFKRGPHVSSRNSRSRYWSLLAKPDSYK